MRLDKGGRNIFLIWFKSVVCTVVIPIMHPQERRKKMNNLRKSI